jgi:tetratricopeptide (TPR) repeat protein
LTNVLSRIGISAFLTISTCCAHSYASDPFTDGCADYSAGNFGKAKIEFASALKANPKSWRAEYQLANTHMALQETAKAKEAYQRCLGLKPDPEIKKHCESAIAFIVNPPKSRPVAPLTTQPQSVPSAVQPSSLSPGASEGADEVRKTIVEEWKANVMKDAKIQVDAIKEEQKRAIDEGNANAPHRYRNYDTGERYTKMYPEEKASIDREYDARIKRVMDDARRRAENMTAP